MASPATFVAYIDEAGDEGFKFGKGSSEWFVLGAAILRRDSEMPEIKLVDEVRERLNRGRKPDRIHPARKALHFRDLEHNIRKYYAARIARSTLTTAVVLIKKRDLLTGNETTAEEKQLRSVLYHSAVVSLIETISYYCATEYIPPQAGDGSVDLVFSSRSSLDYTELKNVIEMVRAEPANFGYPGYADSDIIRVSQLQAIMHSKSMGLQIADAITSSYYYAVEASADGLNEDAYVRLLLPCACRRGEALFGYGAKFPHCSEATLKEMRVEVTRWER